MQNPLNIFRNDKLKLDIMMSYITWLEKQDANVRLIPNGRVSVEVFGTIEGVRVRRCAGWGSDLISAIQDAMGIIAERDLTAWESGK